MFQFIIYHIIGYYLFFQSVLISFLENIDKNGGGGRQILHKSHTFTYDENLETMLAILYVIFCFILIFSQTLTKKFMYIL